MKMKTMKNKVTMLIAMVLFAIVLVPAVKTEAAQTAPSGINLHIQSGNQIQIRWKFDSNLYPYYYYDLYGYEVEFYTLKNKKFASYNSSKNSSSFIMNNDYTQTGIEVSNSKFKTGGYKIRVRAFYTEDGTNYDYSKWVEKVIIPRATIKNVKLAKGTKMKVSWSKVSGAKSYTLYFSKNGTSWKKVVTTKKTSATTKKLTKYQNYYYYVQANGVKYKKKKYNSTKPVIKSSNAKGPYYIYTTYR